MHAPRSVRDPDAVVTRTLAGPATWALAFSQYAPGTYTVVRYTLASWRVVMTMSPCDAATRSVDAPAGPREREQRRRDESPR